MSRLTAHNLGEQVIFGSHLFLQFDYCRVHVSVVFANHAADQIGLPAVHDLKLDVRGKDVLDLDVCYHHSLVHVLEEVSDACRHVLC